MTAVNQAGSLRQESRAAVERATVLEWEADLPLFRSGVLLRQLGLALGIPVLLILALLLALDWPPDADRLRAIGGVVLIVGGILVVLALLALGLVYGGKYRFRYRLDDDGITAEPIGATARKNRVINLLLVLSGRPSAMGAGLLAQSRQREELSWLQVDRAVPEASSQSIALHKGKRVVMLVVCRPDNQEEVLQAIRRRLPQNGATR